MKKILSLFALLLTIVIGAKAAVTPLDYAQINATTLVYSSKANLTATGYAQDGKGTQTYNTPSSDRGTGLDPTDETSNDYAIGTDAVCVKTSGSNKEVLLYVTNVTQIDVYAKNNNGDSGKYRQININATPSDATAAASVVGDDLNSKETASARTSLALNPTKAYTISITSPNGDLFVYAIRLTAQAASTAPTITTNLPSTADAIVGVAQNFSIDAEGAASYQWYKASSTTADPDNDEAIEGATAATYSYTATAAGTEYIYCVASNSVGGTPSNVCAVTATAVTLYSVTYDLGDATAGTAPTQASLPEGDTFEVAAAPSDLVAPANKEFKCWNDGTDDYNPGATYTVGTSDVTLTAVYQDKTYQGLTPEGTLDLSDGASTTFTTTWYTGSNVTTDCYYNAPGGVVTFSPYAVYQDNKADNTQTWATHIEGSSTSNEWDATEPFMGSANYFSTSSKAATARNATRNYYYRVTNCTGVSALMGAKGVIEAYEVASGVVSADPVVGPEEISAAGTVSLTGLDASKEYIIKVYGNNSTNNVLFQEIAFYFPAVASENIAFSDVTTYVTKQALDFTDVTEISAYAVTQIKTTSVATEKVGAVPAGTPLLIKATGAVNVDVPVIIGADAITNLLLASDGEVKGDGSTIFAYSKNDKKFKKVASTVTIPAGKAYLVVDGNAPTTLDVDFESEATGVNGVAEAKAEVAPVKVIKNGKLYIGNYNVAGQLVK